MNGDGVVLAWNGPTVVELIESAMSRRLEDVANDVAVKTRRLLDAAGGPSDGRRSEPGEVPRRQSGALKDSIAVESADQPPLTYRVQTDLDYGLWLETGTSRMQRRPYLTRAFEELLDRVRQRLTSRLD